MGSKRGGAREGAGRKPLSPLPSARQMVTLPVEVVEYLERLGDGSVSRGVLVLVEKARTRDET